MMLTTKGRYAIMAVVYLAQYDQSKPITLQDISIKQNIALNYLEQIFIKLRKAEIVKAFRGPNGGYILNYEARDLKVSAVIDAVLENIKMTRCDSGEDNGCMPGKIKCNTHYLWDGLSRRIKEYFEAISIEDIVTGKIRYLEIAA